MTVPRLFDEGAELQAAGVIGNRGRRERTQGELAPAGQKRRLRVELDVEQVKKLASMPPREQMLAELGAGLQSPMAAFVGALNGLLYMFAGALEGLKQQKQGA